MKKILFTDRKNLKNILFSGGGNKSFNFLNLHDMYWLGTDRKFRKIISNENAINLVDGFVPSFFLSFLNFKKIKRFSGTDFTFFVLKNNRAENKKHLLIGLESQDIDALCKKFPSLKKTELLNYNPPYIQDLNFPEEEINKISKIISSKKVDFVWIGLGCPKQNFLAESLQEKSKVNAFFNVGAALDFVMEKKKRAPKIIRTLGIEWFYRLLTDFHHSKKKVWRSFIGLLYLNQAKLKRN